MIELSEEQKQILQGKICPYCKGKTEITLASEIYGKPMFGKNYGNIWICRPCDAYVGCHKGTNVALGRLADFPLRIAKQKAHKAFDRLWKEEEIMKREEAYGWLADILELPKEYCHIGMFSVKTCERVVEESDKLYKQYF